MEDGGKFEPVIGNPGDGASPHCAITDEYHEHQTSALVDTMKTGMGAREQPLELIISTAGSNLAGPCREDWKACEKLLEAMSGFVDESHFAVIWGLDAGDDWTDPAALAKANPNWGVSVNPEVILPELEVAKRDPRKQSAFKTKHLNEWVSAKNAYFNVQSWENLANPALKQADFAQYPCYLGADLATRTDLSVLMFLYCLPNRRYALFGKYYLPEATVELPENQHYSAWARAGWITKTEGDITDLMVMADDAEQAAKDNIVEELVMDPGRAWLVATEFRKRGLPVVEYRNTVLMMSEPMKELDALITSGRIQHNGDPVLTWAISNVTTRQNDPKDNVFPSKESREQKIDPVVASIFALGRAMTRPDEAVISSGFSFG